VSAVQNKPGPPLSCSFGDKGIDEIEKVVKLATKPYGKM
jgi:hypothetical protein